MSQDFGVFLCSAVEKKSEAPPRLIRWDALKSLPNPRHPLGAVNPLLIVFDGVRRMPISKV